MNLTNKSVVVTGSNGALGKVVVEKVISLSGTPIEIDLNSKNENNQNNSYAVDLSDQSATQSLFEDIADVDVVLNIAGGFEMGPTVYETSEEDWDAMFTMNVKTLHNVIRACVPIMIRKGRGSIVNVGAVNALKGLPNMGAYCAAKSTVMRMTESLSEELRKENINVNAVLPSIIDTPRNRADMPGADYSKWLSPEKLANVICFLGSEDASAVTGALVPVTK